LALIWQANCRQKVSINTKQGTKSAIRVWDIYLLRSQANVSNQGIAVSMSRYRLGEAVKRPRRSRKIEIIPCIFGG